MFRTDSRPAGLVPHVPHFFIEGVYREGGSSSGQQYDQERLHPYKDTQRQNTRYSGTCRPAQHPKRHMPGICTGTQPEMELIRMPLPSTTTRKARKAPVVTEPAPETAAAFLDSLTATGWTDLEAQEIARQLQVAESEIDMWAGLDDAANAEQHLKSEISIAIIAAGIEQSLLKRGHVETPAILKATSEQLLEFIDAYYASLDAAYREMVEIHKITEKTWANPRWCELRAQFDRQAGYLWECELRAGVKSLNERVLA